MIFIYPHGDFQINLSASLPHFTIFDFLLFKDYYGFLEEISEKKA